MTHREYSFITGYKKQYEAFMQVPRSEWIMFCENLLEDDGKL